MPVEDGGRALVGEIENHRAAVSSQACGPPTFLFFPPYEKTF